MKRLFLGFLLFLHLIPARAGGDFYDFKIEEFNQKYLGRYFLVIKPESVDRLASIFSSCEQVVIRGRYSFYAWKIRTRWPNLSYSEHVQNVATLSRLPRDSSIALGTIGGGLRQVQPCVFISDGLSEGQFLKDGRFAVISLYESW